MKWILSLVLVPGKVLARGWFPILLCWVIVDPVKLLLFKFQNQQFTYPTIEPRTEARTNKNPRI
jgi:hypothetical protein